MRDDMLAPSAVPCLFDANLKRFTAKQLQIGIVCGRDLQLKDIQLFAKSAMTSSPKRLPKRSCLWQTGSPKYPV
jgi:hypothetical protein